MHYWRQHWKTEDAWDDNWDDTARIRDAQACRRLPRSVLGGASHGMIITMVEDLAVPRLLALRPQNGGVGEGAGAPGGHRRVVMGRGRPGNVLRAAHSQTTLRSAETSQNQNLDCLSTF